MQVDILAFGAHPDDVEIGCGGTIAKHVAQGHSIGLVDLTRGEMGSRGTVIDRDREGIKAAQILGASFRVNLDLPDGRLVNDFESQQRIIELLRLHKPRIVLCNARAIVIPTMVLRLLWWSKPVLGLAFISGNPLVKTAKRSSPTARSMCTTTFSFMTCRPILP